MNKAKEKAFEYIFEGFSKKYRIEQLHLPSNYRTFKAIDIAIKETINDRDRIHEISLECARQGAKKEIYDKLLKIFQDCNDCRVFEIQCKLGALLKEIDNSLNTEKKQEGENGS